MPDEDAIALPTDDFIVRVFTLADYAEANPLNGKLYITGGGIANIWTAPVPGNLTPIYLAFRVRVPAASLTDQFKLSIHVLTEDGNPVGPSPLLDRKIEMGRQPGYRPGDEAAFNGAMNLGGLPIRRYGTIHIHLEVEDRRLASLPLKIEPLTTAPAYLLR